MNHSSEGFVGLRNLKILARQVYPGISRMVIDTALKVKKIGERSDVSWSPVRMIEVK